jgi:hypothetical protein
LLLAEFGAGDDVEYFVDLWWTFEGLEGFEGFRVSEFGMLVSGFRVSGFQSFRVSEFQGFRFQGFRVSGFQGTERSRGAMFQVSGFGL